MINSFRNYSLLLVVFIHAHIYLLDYTHVEVPVFLSTIYFNFFGYFHPASILAAISGYLFFKDFSNDPERWNRFLKEKYAKRIKSILVPFVFWVAFFFVVNNLIIYAGSYFKRDLFVSTPQVLSPLNFIKALFFPELAVAKHLWYLNNLLFVFVLAPLFPWVTKNIYVFLCLLIAIMVFYWWVFEASVVQSQLIIKYRFIMFFLVGAFFGLHKQYFTIFLTKKLLLSVIGIVISALLYIFNGNTGDYATLYTINSLIIPVLVFYFAVILLQKFGTDKETIYNRSNHFLLYIIHPMFISLLCKLMLFMGLMKTGNYFLVLLMVFALSWVVVKLNTLTYNFLSKYFKTFTHTFL